MAVGTSFLAMLDMLREDVGRSTNVGVGVDDLPALKRSLNRSYALLYDEHSWPHLHYKAPRITLNAGQRYYDYPALLSFTRVVEVNAWYGTQPYPLLKGIGAYEYAIFDSVNNVRAEPPQRWDIQFSGTATQFEVWPVPSTNANKIEMIGTYKITKLLNDEDLCYLDDELVVLGAAVRTLKRQKSGDAGDAADEFNARLASMKKNSSPGTRVTMGGNPQSQNRRSTVVIGGR